MTAALEKVLPSTTKKFQPSTTTDSAASVKTNLSKNVNANPILTVDSGFKARAMPNFKKLHQKQSSNTKATLHQSVTPLKSSMTPLLATKSPYVHSAKENRSSNQPSNSSRPGLKGAY